MLYLNRKPGEAVIINHTIEVRVVEVRGRTVKLGFTFPPEASVLREEVFETVRRANEAAAEAVLSLSMAVPGEAASPALVLPREGEGVATEADAGGPPSPSTGKGGVEESSGPGAASADPGPLRA